MNICKNQAFIAAIVIFSIIIVILFLRWDYMWKDDFLSKWASLITILSVIGVPSAYFSNQNRKESEEKQEEEKERKQASQNLYGELQDTLDSLDRTKFPKDASTLEIKGQPDIFFMNRDLNHDFYDSLVFSGKINFLRHELQQEVQDVFKRIKMHNEYLTLVMKMQDEQEDNSIPEKTYKYYKWMDHTEVVLAKEIPEIQKKLKEDFKLNS